MSVTIPLATIQPGVSAPAGSPALDVDAVDLAIYNMASTLLSYVRPKRLTAATALAAFKDRVGATVTPGNGVTFSAADADLNGRNALNLTAATSNGAVQVPETPSFTFVAPIVPTAFPANAYSANIFGSDAGIVSYLSGDGTKFDRLVVSGNWNTQDGQFTNMGQVLALNTKALLWISYDAATKTWRYGVNSAAPIGSLVGAAARRALVAANNFHPFGFTNGSNPARLKHSGWAIFEAAYGAGGSADVNFAALIAAWKTHMGIA